MPDVLPAGPTLFDAFVLRVKAQPDATAFIFVDDAGEQETPVSNRELDERARRIAAVLLHAGAQGQPVMLLYTPGLDYISALLGCLYAGCIAVPAYPPLHQRQASRVQSLIDDARAAVVLTNASWFDAALLPPPGDHPCTWIHTGRAPHADVPPWTGQPRWLADDTVVLQYTSGSTGQPKGVMLSAGMLTHNVQHMARRLACRPDMRGVTWLPPYHDMGLIAGILLPLYVGFVGVTMTPASFAQRPLRWLQAVSRHRAEITGGPNAAYELCVDKVSDEQLATLDLRSWRVAVNGAEPVRASTLHRFSARFAACGFASRTFHPCYGLAEATLFVTGDPWDAEVDAGFDPADDAQQAVPLGRSLPDQAVRIVDADTCQPCTDGVEGEVWVRGPSVASGYWRQPELSDATFRARLHSGDTEDAQSHWLRTGDLGLLTDGTLRVTGRIKDQINLAGRKLYPHDIEQAAQRSHAALRKHSGAAFAVPGPLRDHLVLVQELEPRAKADPDEVLAAIRQALSRELGVQADDICLVKAGVVDKTSSGKVRRSSCRQAYIDGQIASVARSHRPEPALDGVPHEQPLEVPQHPAAMLDLLRQHLARQLAVSVDHIDSEATLAELGVDSLALTQLQAQLDRLGAPTLPLHALFESPLRQLAVALLPPAQAAPSQGRLPSAAPATDPAAAHAPFPLTPLQQAYVLGRGEVSAHVYSQHEVGQLDLHRLHQAWLALCQRHPMLRVRMAAWPLQRILPAAEPQATPTWQHHHWSELQAEEAQTRLDALAQQLAHQVLPVDGPLCEVHLCHLPEGRVRLLVSIDMLMADATSLYTLLADWGRLYAQVALPPLSLSFRDLVQHSFAQGQRPTAQAAALAARDAWQVRLPELPGAPELPLLPPAPAAHRFTRRSLQLSAPHWQALRQRARRLGVTPAMLLLRAYAEVLGLFAREPRFTLMLTLFNRPAVHPDVAQVVGDFTSVLPLAFDLQGDDFEAALRHTQANFLSALDRQACDGLDVQREHRRLHGSTALPLSAFVFTCLLREQPDSQWLGEPIEALSQTPQVWLDHQVIEAAGGLQIAWDAREACFPEGLLDEMFAAWRRLLHTLAEQARQGHPLQAHGPRVDGRSALLKPGYTPPLLPELADSPPPREALHAPFLRQAARQAQAPAMRSQTLTLSYGELAARSQALAHQLLNHGAQPNTLVGIVMDKGWEQVVAVLGVGLGAAAYLPIDAELPAARIAQLIARGGVRCVLIQVGHPVRARLPDGLLVLEIGQTWSPALADRPPLPTIDPDDLAYVIFTSGSTGEPKGVAMTHAATLNTVLDVNARGQVDSRDVVLALSALNFDLSVWDIFGTLAAGACIAMPEPDMRRDTARLATFSQRMEVSIVNAVPALVQLMVEHAETGGTPLPASLRWVMMSGDWIPVSLPDRLRALQPQARLLAMGGATEAAIWSNSFPIDEVSPHWPSVPYGRALLHQQMVVLDHAGHPRPAWVPGEIHIGGVGLAQGYWRDPATTAARFVTHPHTGQRLYRTGDLGRHLPDGNIEFLGRLDKQVKVAGHRIEPGEIEHQARQLGGVREALVMVHAVQGAPRLVGFVLPLQDARAPDHPELIQALRQHLRQHLPAYMQPSQWQVLGGWPLSPNGKVDHHALMALLQQAQTGDGTAATGASEARPDLPPGGTAHRVHELLCRTWGLHELPWATSFLDLGLNSIDLMRGANALGQTLGVRPAIHQLFEAPTLAQVVAFCEAAMADGRAPATRQPDAVTPTQAATGPEATWAPLTPGQRSLWLLEQLHPADAAYNEPVVLHLRGPLNQRALQAALQGLVARHSSLRTRFTLQDGQPVQTVVSPDEAATWALLRTRHVDELQDHAALRQLLTPWVQTPFDLSQGPLLRALLLRPAARQNVTGAGAPAEQVLALLMHHIVCDGWSQAVLQQELAWLYAVHSGLPGADAQALPALPLSFTAHAWHTHELASAAAHTVQAQAREAALTHWRTQLAEPLPLLDLPTDHPRSAWQQFDGRSHSFTIDEATLTGLRALAKSQHTTLHTVLMAAYAVLLSRHSGQTELCIGTPVAGRDRPELEPLIGYLVDTVALRCHLDEAAPFTALLQQVHDQMQAARQHQALHFAEIVEALQPRRHAGRTPVFQTLLALQNTPTAHVDVAGLQAGTLALDLARAKFDLVLEFMDSGAAGQASRASLAHADAPGLSARFTYASALFAPRTVAAMAAQLTRLLSALTDVASITSSAARPLRDLPLLTEAQTRQLTRQWSGFEAAQSFTREHPAAGSAGTLLALMRQHAIHTPNALALRFESEAGLSHRELARMSDQAAHRLLQRGVQAGQLIGLSMPRSQALLVSLLAIWKAGCAYLPLDPTYPAERLALMAEDAQLRWVITQPELPAAHWPAGCQTVLAHELLATSVHTGGTTDADAPALPEVNADQPAYVIYTSGSTGRPKGTQVAHHSVFHLAHAAARTFGLAAPVRMLQLASLSFDAALIEMVMAWARGGSLHLIDQQTLMDMPRLVEVMKAQAIDAVVMPPSLAMLLPAAELPALRTVLVGGDRCPAELAVHLGPQVRLFNGYGPTETTVCPTAHFCSIEEAGPRPLEGPQIGPAIGRPLPGATVYVLDAQGRLVPPRVAGELYIGGTGLAMGYLHRPELTAERFVPHPFEPGQRLYRSGDLVRWDHDGQLHFLGRIDQQVKLRGMRIELGEIEAVLRAQPGVQDAVVMAHAGRGELTLCAHVQPTADAPPGDQPWREGLARLLPPFMVPPVFMRHAALPTLPNGKVNRLALPEPDAGLLSQAPFMGPRDPLELAVLQLWEEVLGRQGFGILDNFFDLGGHSLKAIRLLGRIQQTFGIDLSVASLMQTPTVEAVAAALRQQTPPSTSSLVPIRPQGSRPPIYFVHAAGGTVMCYHELARHMSPEQPVYGLQAQGIEAGTEPAANLPAMARHYVEAIRTVQPQGPYRIAGWSMGGNIVFEMAQQLLLQGEEVALLGLLDASAAAFNNPTPVRDNAAILAEMFSNEFDVDEALLRQLPQDTLIEQAVALAESHKWLPPGFTVDQAHRILRVYRESEAAIKQHRPAPLACDAILYRTHEVIEGEDDEAEDRGWTPLVSGQLHIASVPGNHINMVMAPHSETLARCIDAHLAALLPAPL